MNIYMMRHGETEMNIKRLLQGQIDSHLNDKGRGDALRAGDFFKAEKIDPDYIWTSPLDRAMETAELATGKKRSSFVSEPLLIEMSFGDYEGKCVKLDGEGNDDMNPVDRDFARDFFKNPEKCVMPANAESFDDIIERAGCLLKKVADFDNSIKKEPGYGEKSMLLVSHGALLHGVLANINKTPLHDFWKQKFKNCEIIRLTRDESGFSGAEIVFEGFDRGGMG